MFQNLSLKENTSVELLKNIESFIFREIRREISNDQGSDIFINNLGTFHLKRGAILYEKLELRKRMSDKKMLSNRKFKQVLRKLYTSHATRI